MFLKYIHSPLTRSLCKHLPVYLGLVLLFFGLKFFIIYNLAPVKATLEIQTSTPARFQLFWRISGQNYDGNRSVIIDITAEQTLYTCLLPSLSKMDYLRLDPTTEIGEVVIDSLVLTRSGDLSVVLFSEQKRTSVINFYQIGSMEYLEHGGVRVTTTGSDGQIEVSLRAQYLYTVLLVLLLVSVIVALVLNLFMDPQLLKGSLQSGRIVLNLPVNVSVTVADSLLTVVKNSCGNCRLLSVNRREGMLVYLFLFSTIESSQLTDLLNKLRSLCSDIRCQVFYNRSGEV